MSIKIWKIRFILTILIMVFIVKSLVAEEDKDPILSFYCQRAKETSKSRHPFGGGVNFSFQAHTYYYIFGNKGKVTLIDSTVIDIFFSFGELDSSKTIVASQGKQATVNFTYPNIFDSSYYYYFFPNDTGGIELSIGFDTYTIEDEFPVGFAVIDRGRYFLRWLYLHYPNKKGYKRFSRSFRFIEHEGYIFPDSIWEIYGKVGIFSTEYYQVETGITNLKIYR